jgi:hypothetical protein
MKYNGGVGRGTGWGSCSEALRRVGRRTEGAQLNVVVVPIAEHWKQWLRAQPTVDRSQGAPNNECGEGEMDRADDLRAHLGLGKAGGSSGTWWAKLLL